ncbi:MAG TPA: hypothetical protein VFL71_18870 [Actinomycetes bacterium]|nr:hypothetical protein [Actinomycetes bacterium]
MTSDFHGPDRTGGRTAMEPPVPVDDLFVEPPAGHRAPPSRPGAYWTGLVVLAIGLAVTVGALATRVTSIVQTVLLAVPLALVGLGLERVGRGVGRGSLRSTGVLLLLVAVIGPVVLSLSSPDSVVIAQPSADVPSGATKALLRASVGGGQLRIGSEAPGLYRAELRGPGQPSDQVTTTDDKEAVVDLRGPVRRGLLARNRGNDWAVSLTTALPWSVEVDAGAVTADLELRELDLRGVEIDAGVSRLALRLGQPAGRIPIDLRVSTGLIDVHLPRAAACEVRVDGFSLDNLRQAGLVNEGGVWRTGDAGRAERYVINVRTSGGRIRLHRE